MERHGPEWRRIISLAQKRRWKRDKANGKAAAMAAAIGAKLRRTSDGQVELAYGRLAKEGGPTIKALASELGVTPPTLSKALAGKYGKETVTRLARARMADAMKGNNRGEGSKRSRAGLKRLSTQRRGAANPNWRGGLAVGPRNNRKYQAFRRWILERDGRKCTDCGTSERRLDVHHIIAETARPDLLYDEKNCTTLCVLCHEKRHGKRRR